VTDPRARIEAAAPSRLAPDRVEEAVAALCDAFHDYPVMTYIVGEAGAEYDRRLRELIHVFVSARVLRGEPILAIEDSGRPVAIATLTPPGERPVPPAFPSLREVMWDTLGAAARARYETLVAVWERHAFPSLHYHLNMLGVRRSHAGRGLGGRLLNEVHALSAADPQSSGVSLSTEDPKNVALYRHCGYEVVAHEQVTDELETWQFFRPDDDVAAGAHRG
jgi:GNAT superfamily N-acetyltransferase